MSAIANPTPAEELLEHQPFIRRYVCSRVRTRCRAMLEDEIQSAYVDCLEAFGKYPVDGRWTNREQLAMYAVRTGINRRTHYRLCKKRSALRTCGLASDPQVDDTALDELMRDEQVAVLLGRLQESERTLLRLTHWEGLTLQSIAFRMGRTVPTVCYHLQKIYEQLRLLPTAA